jgi:hypothetical protein
MISAPVVGWWCCVGPASAGVPARRAGSALAELGELVAVGVDDPPVRVAGFLAGVDPAAADPAVEGDRWHGELGGEVVQPPFVGAGSLAGWWGDALAGERPGAAELVQQLGDGADPDAVASLGGPEALGVQPSCDGLGAVALLGQLADPLEQLRVGAELGQAGDGADGLTTGGVPACPG